MNGQYITISVITNSGLEYTSAVHVRPVDTADSASFTCTASVHPTSPHTDNITSSIYEKLT